MPILKRANFFFSAFFRTSRFWLLPLLAGLILLLLFKACSSKHPVKKSIYYIGRENAWQIELLGRERSLIAFTNDLMATIGLENQIRFEWVETNPSYLLRGLDNSSYDFILTSIRPNVVNQERYDFSELLFDLGPVLVVREDSQISSLKELKGQPIGVPYGFSSNFNAVRTPGVNLYEMSFVYYNDINHALESLINDSIDGVIMKSIPAYALIQGLYAGKLKIVTAPFNDEGLRIASLKSSSLEDVINMINDSIDKMRKDGTYKALIMKWNLIDPQTQYWQPPQKNPHP